MTEKTPLQELIEASEEFLAKSIEYAELGVDITASDVQNMTTAHLKLETAIDKAWKSTGEITPMIIETEPSEHKAVQQNDEMFCHKCGKRWGVDEDPPGCV